ncbi:MAG: FadR family transcriptional regulator [Planctomycetaceae bacterium]|nr:FadR family transcriptional regulator [Planctomycetaceae bacterium]
MALKKIEKQAVGDRVFEAIHQEIMDGAYKPGEKLPSERELSEELGVSKSSIKVAMQRLVALGLVEMRRGEGNFIREFSTNPYMEQVREFLVGEEDVAKITEYRFYMEMAIVRLAMKRAKPAHFARMKTILKQMEAAARDGDLVLHGRLDYDFHLELCRATGNDIFVKSYELIGHTLRGHATLMNEGYFEQLLRQKPGEDVHWRLYTAVKDKDIDACRRCLAEMFSVFKKFPDEHLLDG